MPNDLRGHNVDCHTDNVKVEHEMIATKARGYPRGRVERPADHAPTARRDLGGGYSVDGLMQVIRNTPRGVFNPHFRHERQGLPQEGPPKTAGQGRGPTNAS